MYYLADCLADVGDYRKATALAQESLTILRGRLPADHLNVTEGC